MVLRKIILGVNVEIKAHVNFLMFYLLYLSLFPTSEMTPPLHPLLYRNSPFPCILF